jgi:hypothetical protein
MTEINCECGWVIKGNSIKHAESNMKQHIKSKLHKTLIKNRESSGSLPSNKQKPVYAHKTKEVQSK